MWPGWIKQATVTSRKGTAEPRPKRENSPYFGVDDPGKRLAITKDLLASHPLSGPDIRDAVLQSWESIFESRLGSGFHIGREIKPVPQIMGFLLHALIPLELAKNHDGWRADADSSDKDLVYIPDKRFSIEIKTSTNPRQIFGNRSFGVDNPGKGKKAKDGYYLAINFDRWQDGSTERPRIRMIRYGWVDHTDWVAQKAETGQQSSLPPVVDNTQFLILYAASSSSEQGTLEIF
ncbi:MAG: ScaI family restriction endonuclease [Blastocatellia bacterium]|nr:ScaI family restriction endonuclease [Blastocatellia bacterium]